MLRKNVVGFSVVSDVSEFAQEVPFESLGARIRNALDSGVMPVGKTPLAFDEAEDGDFVDPSADPREDMFSVAERLDSHERALLAKKQEIDKSALSSGGKSGEEGQA